MGAKTGGFNENTKENDEEEPKKPKKRGFYPNSMDISTMTKPQLIGWINIQTGDSHNELFDPKFLKPDVLKIAKKIKREMALR